MKIGFDAFISYSRTSEEIAKVLVPKLKRIGVPPWQFGKRSGLKIFWDRGEIRTGDLLGEVIENAIKTSDYFILLASKRAAKSIWVERELKYWLDNNKPVSKILIVVLDGAIDWDYNQNDFDWNKTTCLPQILKGRCKETCWKDLYKLTSSIKNKKDKEIIEDCVVSIAAKILDKRIIDIRNKEVSQRRSFKAVLSFSALILFITTLYLGYWIWSQSEADKLYIEGKNQIEDLNDWKDIKNALGKFEAALKLNPSHIQSLIDKADALTLLIGYGGSDDPARDLEVAENNLLQVETFGGNNSSEYFRVKGRLLMYKDYNFTGAKEFFEKAVKADSNNMRARYGLASAYTFLGDHEKALNITNEAIEFIKSQKNEPNDDRLNSAKFQLAWTNFYAGNTQSTIEICKELPRVKVSPGCNRYIAHAYVITGNPEDAITQYTLALGQDLSKESIKNIREPNIYPVYICSLYLSKKISLLDAKNKLSNFPHLLRESEKYVSPYRLAQGFACIDSIEESFELLEIGRIEYDPYIVWAAVDPLLSNLRKKKFKEFREYLNKIGLGEAVNQ